MTVPHSIQEAARTIAEHYRFRVAKVCQAETESLRCECIRRAEHATPRPLLLPKRPDGDGYDPDEVRAEEDAYVTRVLEVAARFESWVTR